MKAVSKPDIFNARRVLATLTAVAAVAATFAVASVHADITATEKVPAYFHDIDGIAADEIQAADSVIARWKERGGFTYAMLESSKCFTREDGTIGGFGAAFTERLSKYLGIPVNLKIVTRAEMLNGLTSGAIDFCGDLSASSSDSWARPYGGVIATEPIGERAMMTARLTDAQAVEAIAASRPVVIAVREGGSAQAILEETPPGYDFKVIVIDGAEQARKVLRDGTADMIFADSAFIDEFRSDLDIEQDNWLPLNFKDVSIMTLDPELEPIIRVIDKYLAHGGMQEINAFYSAGDLAFNQESFIRSLDADERAWYDEHIDTEEPVRISISNSNYPVNFYNESEDKYEGIAIDILNEIKQITGLKFKMVNEDDAPWSEALRLLASGEAQMTAELIKTSGTEKDYLFGFAPYSTDRYALISLNDTPDVSVNQILYADVGLVDDTGYTDMFRQWFPSKRDSTVYEGIDAAFDALKAGDIDLLMATENRLLTMSNYREETGFKTNLAFNYEAESRFGFNENESTLKGIIDKAQVLTDTEAISGRWEHTLFDYRKQMAEKQSLYMVAISGVLALVIILLFVLMRHRKHNEDKLQELVTERTQELEEQTRATEAANNAKSDFLANMSHEMRTPLNAVIGLSELSLTQDYSAEETDSNLEKIYSSGVTLLGLVNDILDLSKIESGKFELVPVDYDIPSLINDTVTLNIIRIGSKPIRFNLEIEPDMPARLYGDELRIKQIFNNLLSNAFKYTKEGEVTWSVSCERDADDPEKIWLVSEVRDTGIGIKPENLDKVFGEYSQVDTKANRKIEGTGLGLAITKHMIGMMDGEVTVESEYGHGSCFRVRLAQGRVSDDVIGEKVVENIREFRYADHKRDRNASFVRAHIPYASVLVVDDVTTNLDVARGLLKPYGIKVDTVTSGQAAIDLIKKRETEYNAIFMDHMMPGMDGIEATHIIKEEIGTDYARNIPVIALTANAIAGNDEMFLSNGFHDFLSKPIDIIKLDAVINRWVRDKAREKELCTAEGGTAGPCGPAGSGAGGSGGSGPAGGGSDGTQRLLEGRSLHGVDLREGLARFGGDGEIYIGVLRSYAENTPELIARARELSRDTLADYAITVHGIKGASRNIGALTLGDKAEELEKAAKAGDYGYVAQNNDEFLDKAEKTIAGIEDLLAEIDAVSARDTLPEPDRGVLESLLEAAESFDIDEADRAMSELEKHTYQTGTELVAWLRSELGRAGFANIKERLGQELGQDAERGHTE
jgi:signal transduction histidine kinase/HPt (histidine-containing phosphotransfer) domain-containing protein/AmiR/NasT family two-component response regulator